MKIYNLDYSVNSREAIPQCTIDKSGLYIKGIDLEEATHIIIPN